MNSHRTLQLLGGSLAKAAYSKGQCLSPWNQPQSEQLPGLLDRCQPCTNWRTLPSSWWESSRATWSLQFWGTLCGLFPEWISAGSCWALVFSRMGYTAMQCQKRLWERPLRRKEGPPTVSASQTKHQIHRGTHSGHPRESGSLTAYGGVGTSLAFRELGPFQATRWVRMHITHGEWAWLPTQGGSHLFSLL